jgi:hypothetical protein
MIFGGDERNAEIMFAHAKASKLRTSDRFRGSRMILVSFQKKSSAQLGDNSESCFLQVHGEQAASTNPWSGLSTMEAGAVLF